MINQMNQLFAGMGGTGTSMAEPMAVDVAERDDEFVVTAETPGFDREDLELTLSDQSLRITANREESTDENDETYIRRERSRRSMSRTVPLPEEVDESGASAEFNNGVLTVTLPKRRDGEDSRSIEIE